MHPFPGCMSFQRGTAMREVGTQSGIRVQWPAAAFVAITLALAWWYLLSVEAHRFASPDDTAFIRPVVYILTVLSPFVLWTCVVRPISAPQRSPATNRGNAVVLAAIPIALASIYFFGFLITAIIGAFALAWVLSGKSIVTALLAAAFSGFIVFGLFESLLDIGLPLFPGGN